MSALDQIVKAYDIRGTVPDQLDADVAHALGVGFASSHHRRRPRRRRRATCGRPGPRSSTRSPGLMEQGVDVDRLGLGVDRPHVLRVGRARRSRARCSPPPTIRPATTASSCACAGAGRSASRPVSTTCNGRQRVLDGTARAGGRRPGRAAERDLLDDFVEHVLTFVDARGHRSDEGRRRHRERHGRPRRPGGDGAARAVELEVMYGELDGTFPNHPADPLQPANQRDLRARVVAADSTSGWRSTVTPTACSSSTRRARG